MFFAIDIHYPIYIALLFNRKTSNFGVLPSKYTSQVQHRTNNLPMINYLRLLLILLIVALTATLKAQINVIAAGASSFSPEELITNVFLGEGVNVTKIEFYK